tara:strand:+ start:170 stop:607 length:438 start_codon:yes stop_codon:yes gene_type:complete
MGKITKYKKILLIFLSIFTNFCSLGAETSEEIFSGPVVSFLNCPNELFTDNTLEITYRMTAGEGDIKNVDIKIYKNKNIIISYKIDSRANANNYKFLEGGQESIYDYELNNSGNKEPGDFIFTIKVTDELNRETEESCRFSMKSG